MISAGVASNQVLRPYVTSPVAITDRAAGGSIGAASDTVDIYGAANVNQTTAAQTLSLPSPTNTSAIDRYFSVHNVGSVPFSMLGCMVPPESALITFWDGVQWTPASPPTSNVFIFKPGGTASGNVYSSWPALYAASQVVSGPKQIWFDDSAGAVSIPVGAYDFGRDCAFIGVVPNLNGTASNRVTVTCPDGVTFTTPIHNLVDINLTYTGTHALMTVPANGKFYHCFIGGFARATATGVAGTIFSVPSGAILIVFLTDAAAIVVSGGGFFYDATGATSNISLTITGTGVNNVVPANCLKGVAGATTTVNASRLSLINTTQASISGGTITPAFFFGAPNLPYTPAVGAQWVDPDPTTVQSALDRIAAVVSAGGGTPIP